MSDWSRDIRITREMVYTVQARNGHAGWNQVMQALNAAIQDYREKFTSSGCFSSEPDDNAIRVYPLDDRIEIIFTLPEKEE